MYDSEDRIPAPRGQRMQRLAILGVTVLLLAAVGTPVAVHRLSQSAPTVAPRDESPAPVGPTAIRAAVLPLRTDDPDEPYEQRIDQIARAGFDAVCLSLPGWQDDADAGSIFIETRRMPPEDRLERLIARAHQRGLAVVVMPVVLLDAPAKGESTGTIEPRKPDDWWEDYANFLIFCAYLAQRTEAEALAIGWHLSSLEDLENRWRPVISKVREAYSGRLCYIARGRSYRDIKWWYELDMMGVTVPFGREGGTDPSLARLMESPAPAGAAAAQFAQGVRRVILYAFTGPVEEFAVPDSTSRPAGTEQP